MGGDAAGDGGDWGAGAAVVTGAGDGGGFAAGVGGPGAAGGGAEFCGGVGAEPAVAVPGGHVCGDGMADRVGGGVQCAGGRGRRDGVACAVELEGVGGDCVSVGVWELVRAGGVYLSAEECGGDEGGDVCVCESGDRGAAGGGVAA